MGVDSCDSVTCDVVSGIAGEEWKSDESGTLPTVWGEDQIQHAINGSKRNKQYVHTVDSAFPVFCFVLLFLPLKLFATFPFSTF